MEKRRIKVELEKEENQVFYEILEESNEIMKEYSNIMKVLHEFKMPSATKFDFNFFPRERFNKAKKDLSSMTEIEKGLQTKFLSWQDKTVNFSVNPRYIFKSENQFESYFKFIHYNNILNNRVTKINSSITLLIDTHNLRFSEIENQENLFIALLGLRLSILGLLLALTGLAIAIF